jgi:hypothetical protein
MSAAYIDHGTHLCRLADGALLPKDPGNRDYAMALEQIAVQPSLVATPAAILPLDDVIAGARAEIDAAAERARLRYITPGAGQAQTYQMKLEQAQAYQAAGSPPDATPWPFIAGEAAALGITPSAAANTIIATAAAWVTVGAAIEQARMGGKRAVMQASTVAAVNNALATAVHQLEIA